MRQLFREMKNVLTTWYNVDDNEYWINFGYLTFSSKYVCNIYDWDNVLCRIKYKRHDWIEEQNIYERYTKDKNTRATIRRAWKKYA